jgi:hypothetical protein
MASTDLVLSDKHAEDMICWLYAVPGLFSCFCSQFILMVCAIYWLRFRDTSSSCDASSKRYVITNPPDDFSLLPTDQVSYSCYYDLHSLTFLHAGLSYLHFLCAFMFILSISASALSLLSFLCFPHLIFEPIFGLHSAFSLTFLSLML